MTKEELFFAARNVHYQPMPKETVYKLDTHNYFQRKRLFVKLYITIKEYKIKTIFSLN